MPQSDPEASVPIDEKFAHLEQCLSELRSALEVAPTLELLSRTFAIDEEKVRRVLKVRRIREQQFGTGLFGDPAWDLLLRAFAADLGHKRLSIAELCDESLLPPSTTERWVKTLEQEGWLRRLPGADEQHWIELTPDGSVRLRAHFEAVGTALLFA